VLEGFGMGKISVGAPYFDFMFAVLMLPLTMIVGIGAISRWKKDQARRFKSPGLIIAIICAVIAILVTLVMSSRTQTSFSLGAAAGVFLSVWIAAWTVYGWLERSKNTKGLMRKLKQPAAFIGMSVAHLGIAVFLLGVTHVNTYSIETDVSMNIGDTYQLREFEFEFTGIQRKRIENYIADEGNFIVTRGQKSVTELNPQKRFYSNSNEPMTEAAINTSLSRDLYVSLGEPANQDGSTWSVRLYYKSFVVWIWLGGFIMALGAIIAIFDRRYRKTSTVSTDDKSNDAVSALKTSKA